MAVERSAAIVATGLCRASEDRLRLPTGGESVPKDLDMA
jgi:hypothetical protein